MELAAISQPQYPIIEAGYNGLSAGTQAVYSTDFRQFNNFIGKEIPELMPVDILEYIKHLQTSGLKNSTINRKIYSLSKIFTLYRLQGLMKVNLISELNKIKKITKPVDNRASHEVEILDIQKILQKQNRTTTIIKTLMSTGMRISELINIQTSKIKDFSNGGKKFKKIEITGKGNKQRDIFLTHDLYDDIKFVFGKSPNGFLFFSKSGKPLNRINLYKQIRNCFEKYAGKKINPHQLRHFYATWKIKNEKQDIKAVSKYLGHSTCQITLDMYVETSLDPGSAILNV